VHDLLARLLNHEQRPALVVFELARAKVGVVIRSDALAVQVRTDHRHELLPVLRAYIADLVLVGVQDPNLSVVDQAFDAFPGQFSTSHMPGNARAARVK
jgi:hypothetical protein